MPRSTVAKEDSDFWLSPEIAAKAPKDAQPSFQSAQAIAAPYVKAGKWHTFSGSEPIVDGTQLVPLPSSDSAPSISAALSRKAWATRPCCHLHYMGIYPILGSAQP
jgi:hypothetical protein